MADVIVPDFKVYIDGAEIEKQAIIVSTVTVNNSVEKADSFDMDVLFDFNIHTSMDDLDAKLVMGKEIKIDMGLRDNLKTVFQGYITSVRLEIRDSYEARLVVSGLDKSFLLMKTVQTRSFLKKKYSEIAQSIAGEAGLSATVEDSSQVYEYIEQPGISNYQFLKGLAEKSGSEFFVSDGKLYFRKLPKNKSASLKLKFGQDMIRLNLETDLADQVAGVMVSGWDRKNKQAIKGQADSPTLVGSGKSGGAYLKGMGVTSKLVENYHAWVDSQTKADQIAAARLQSLSLKMVNGTVTISGNSAIKAGDYIELEGLGSRFSKVYYVRAVTHTISEDGFETTVTLGGNSA